MIKYTLIELLLTIAIITILMTLLFPTLKKSKDISCSVVCKSNLKQLSQWGFVYSMDYDEVLPHNAYEWGYPDLGTGLWYHHNPHYKSSKCSETVLHCPQTTKIFKPRWSWQCGFDYGLNANLGGRGRTMKLLMSRK